MPKQPKEPKQLKPREENPLFVEVMKSGKKVIIWIMIIAFLLSVIASAFV